MPVDKKEYMKEYRRKNAIKIRHQRRQRTLSMSEEDRLKKSISDRKYYEKHKTKILEQQKIYYENNKERIKEKTRAWYKNLPIEQKERYQKLNTAWNKEHKEYHREYYLENKDKWHYTGEKKKKKLEDHREWIKKNKDHVTAYNKKVLPKKAEWQRKKGIKDPHYRLDRAVSAAMRKALDNPKNRHWEYFVGYTISDLIKHLENLFEDGMSWENYGQWHIDHIIPKSWFNYKSRYDEEFCKAWDLENLQPMWAHENMSKNNRFAGRVS